MSRSAWILALVVSVVLTPVMLADVGEATLDIDGLSNNKGIGAFPINGDFSSGSLRPWRLHSSAMTSTIALMNEQAVVTVGAEPITQLWQKDVWLQGDTTYVLMFDAKSSLGSNLRARVMRHGMPYESYGLKTNINIRTGMRTFMETFRTTPGDKFDGRISFLLSPFAQPGEVYTFDNVKLYPVGGCGDGIVNPEDGETCEVANATGGVEVATGGDFEGGPNSDWMETSASFDHIVTDAFPFEGNFHAHFGGAPFEVGTLSQMVTIPAGPGALLTFQLGLPNCSGDPMSFFEVTANGDRVFSAYMDDTRCGGTYAQEWIDMTSYTGQTIALVFRGVFGENGIDSAVYLDNVSVKALDASDVCREDCTYCGDGVVDDGEQCDPQDPMAPAGCTSQCTLACPELTLLKQVTCDLGMTWGDSCTGTIEPGNPMVAVRYAVTTTSGSDLENCELTDSNGEVLPMPVDIGDLPPDLGPALLHATDALECSSELAAGEPNTATLTCECLNGYMWDSVSASDEAEITCEDPPGKDGRVGLRNPGQLHQR